jgi:hypothetical protein
MKFLLALILIISSKSFAFSTRECNSAGPQKISYLDDNRVGGIRPFPGMIIQHEELKLNNEVVFREIRRQECRFENCELQQPELTNIASDIEFSFNNESKMILESHGNVHGPIYEEVYVIQLQYKELTWMLCHYKNILAP